MSTAKITAKTYIRRAFPSMESMADYLDRTRQYCSGRLNSDELAFTEAETIKLIEAVRFHNRTEKYLTEVNRDLAEKRGRLAFEVTVFLICNGADLYDSINCGLSSAKMLGVDYSGIDMDMLDFFIPGRTAT